MEQSSGKKERLMLAAGLALALAAAAWQYFSPASRALMAGRDVAVALLGERGAVLLVYHPFSDTVGAFSAPHFRTPRGADLPARAADLAAAALGPSAPERVFHVALASAPAMESFWGVLNEWRAKPRLLWAAAAWLRGLKAAGATDLSGFDLFSLFSEFLRLGSSNFIFSEVPRRGGAEAAPEEEAAPAAPRVEVFNASGRAGLASRTAKRLRALGFDVITEGTLAEEARTRVMGYSRDTAAAERLRAALGLQEREIRVNAGKRSVAAAAVVLGRDFEE